MTRFTRFFLPLLLFSSHVFCQADADKILMTIHDRQITLDEFERIYKKNNSSTALEQQTVEEYLDLFINFKLKVIEAEELGMILGYSSNAFVKFSVFEAVERIADLGFQGIEIMCDRPHLYPPDFQEEDLARLKDLIDGCGLNVTNLNSFTLFAVGDTYLPSWIDPQQDQREIRIQHTLQCLKLALFKIFCWSSVPVNRMFDISTPCLTICFLQHSFPS